MLGTHLPMNLSSIFPFSVFFLSDKAQLVRVIYLCPTGYLPAQLTTQLPTSQQQLCAQPLTWFSFSL